jgi:DNA-binding PadR family transcriptional regulator
MSYLKIYLNRNLKEINMFGMRHREEGRCGGKWSGRRGRHGRRYGWGAGEGSGDDELLRARRMLAHGDLRLIALALIAEQPRHGYEIIKVLEEKTEGWYSPSPGIVYPTLTFLEEAGYVTAQVEGAKKLYTITDEGRAHLADNRDLVDAVLERLAAVGRKIARMRRRFGEDERDDQRPGVPPLVKAAFDNLRETAVKRLEGDADAEAKIVDILARAAGEMKRG